MQPFASVAHRLPGDTARGATLSAVIFAGNLGKLAFDMSDFALICRTGGLAAT